MFLVSMCVRKRSANAGRAWSCRTISGFSTARIVHGAMAVAVAIRCDWPARQPSPKKWPASSTATTASFPACDKTDSRTAPFSTYMTLVAGSPWAKIVVAGFVLDALQSHAGPIDGTDGFERRCALRLCHGTSPPSGASSGAPAVQSTAECDSATVQIDTNARRSQVAKGFASEACPVAASRLNGRDGGNWQPRQVDGEDASPSRQVARIDPAVVRFSAPSAEGETKTQAGSIGAALLERAEQLVDVPARETAAFVLDLDEHALGAGADPERDGGPGPGELEGVLQKVSHDRGEDLPVGLDRHAVFDGRDASV